jgi:hypothetical protein
MDKNNGGKRLLATWQEQTTGKFHVLVVKLDGMLLESGFHPGFFSTRPLSGHPHQKRDGEQRGRQRRYATDARHTQQFDGTT